MVLWQDWQKSNMEGFRAGSPLSCGATESAKSPLVMIGRLSGRIVASLAIAGPGGSYTFLYIYLPQWGEVNQGCGFLADKGQVFPMSARHWRRALWTASWSKKYEGTKFRASIPGFTVMGVGKARGLLPDSTWMFGTGIISDQCESRWLLRFDSCWVIVELSLSVPSTCCRLCWIESSRKPSLENSIKGLFVAIASTTNIASPKMDKRCWGIKNGLFAEWISLKTQE